MKNSVVKRLKEIEATQIVDEEKGKRLEKQLALEIKRLEAYADAVKNNEFGFTSSYKSPDTEFWHNGTRRRLTPQQTKEKVAKIQEEYKCATDIGPTLDRIMGLVKQVCVPTNKEIMLSIIASISDKALNGCIEKGYIDPAIEILSRFSGESAVEGVCLPPKPEKEIKKYLREIISDYAKRTVYKDSAKYLTTANPIAETDVNYLTRAIGTGRFGKQIKAEVDKETVKAYYEHVMESSWGNEKTYNLSRSGESSFN